VPVEIVDGLSEVAGQPRALRVAARLDNCGNCLLCSKAAFVRDGQIKLLKS